MPSYQVTFPDEHNHMTNSTGRCFLIEDVRNEADAINEAFLRAGLNRKKGEPERFIKTDCKLIGVGRKESLR